MPYPNTEHDAHMKNFNYLYMEDPARIDRLARDPNLTVYDADHFVRNDHTSDETILFLYNKYYGDITVEEVEAFSRRDSFYGSEKLDIAPFISYHQLPADVVDMWANSRDWFIIYNLIKQKSLSKETLNNLIFRDDDTDITSCYIEIPNLTEAQIDHLANFNFRSDIYVSFFKQRNLSTATAWKVFTKGMSSDRFPLTLALKKNLPEGMLEKMSEHGDPWVRRKVGLNPKTPVPVLEKLADDPELTVKIGVAKNPNVSAETLGYLHDIGSKQIQNSLDKNPTWQRHIGNY